MPNVDYDDPEELREVAACLDRVRNDLERRELRARRGEPLSPFFLACSCREHGCNDVWWSRRTPEGVREGPRKSAETSKSDRNELGTLATLLIG